MRSRLIIDAQGNKNWVRLDLESKFSGGNRKMNAQGEDLSVNSYINKYGGIKSVIDDSMHTTKASYMDHLKRNNKSIKDF